MLNESGETVGTLLVYYSAISHGGGAIIEVPLVKDNSYVLRLPGVAVLRMDAPNSVSPRRLQPDRATARTGD